MLSSTEQVKNFLLGPLPAVYCDLFYYLGISSLVVAILTLFALPTAFYPRFNPTQFFLLIIISILYFLVYLTDRILYNLCLNNKKAGKEGLSIQPKSADQSKTATTTAAPPTAAPPTAAPEAAQQGGVAKDANKHM